MHQFGIVQDVGCRTQDAISSPCVLLVLGIRVYRIAQKRVGAENIEKPSRRGKQTRTTREKPEYEPPPEAEKPTTLKNPGSLES